MSENRSRKGYPLAMRLIPEGRLMPTYLMARAANERYRQIQRRGDGPLGPFHRPRLGCFAWLIVLIALNSLLAWGVLPPIIGILPAPVLAFFRIIGSMIPLGLVPFAAVLLLAWRFDRPLAQRAARETLNEHGIEVCLTCGYDLRTLPGDIESCPECGKLRPTAAQIGHSFSDRSDSHTV
jgi:predicted RNA-binding Zn-ribbon protein involved in translation (DUF1610 family)